jgi:stress response protein YsnF
MRSEGNTLIIPLLEEVLVVEKRLLLKEELHLTKQRVETHQPQRVTLRREEAAIERVETEPHKDNRQAEENGYGEDRHRTV